MQPTHFPPGIEGPAREAILALAACQGLEPMHLATIRYCIAVCPRGFERAYADHFAGMGPKPTHGGVGHSAADL